MNIQYLKRIFSAYVLKKESQLSFWHGSPRFHEPAFGKDGMPDAYYMAFAGKAVYRGSFDENGIPLLDYHGRIGKQHNPIAVAQYGLGNLNRWLDWKDDSCLEKARRAADWLSNTLEENEHGVPVWFHRFDFEYVELLRNPWYSGLAQGQGISLLLRAARVFDEPRYRDAAQKAFISFRKTLDEGGVVYRDEQGLLWVEEYVTNPPAHILNGFVWALWGVYDYARETGEKEAEKLYAELLETLRAALPMYDCGFWSLYDLSSLKMRNVASPFYHALHIVELEIMARLTGEEIFREYSRKWADYAVFPLNRLRAVLHKAAFKVVYF
jgi:hypothetical protein